MTMASSVGTGASAPTSTNVPVLLVEDDRYIQRSVSFQLSRQGYDVTCCDDGEEGLARALRGLYQVIILDIMLPRLDGLTACKRIRAAFPSLPIIITSARGTDVDKVTGLEFGADDYLAKPFSPAELEARIRAVRRRALAGRDPASLQRVTRGPITLDCPKREVWVRGQLVRLSRREFQILHLLMQNPGRVFSRETLLSHMWGHAYDGFTRAVDGHLSRIRRRLREYLPIDCIESIYGVGYRFVVPAGDGEAVAPPKE